MSAHGTEDVSGLRAQVVQCLGKARIALNGQVVVFQGLRREEIDSQLQNDTHKIIYIYIYTTRIHNSMYLAIQQHRRLKMGYQNEMINLPQPASSDVKTRC